MSVAQWKISYNTQFYIYYTLSVSFVKAILTFDFQMVTYVLNFTGEFIKRVSSTMSFILENDECINAFNYTMEHRSSRTSTKRTCLKCD